MTNLIYATMPKRNNKLTKKIICRKYKYIGQRIDNTSLHKRIKLNNRIDLIDSIEFTINDIYDAAPGEQAQLAFDFLNEDEHYEKLEKLFELMNEDQRTLLSEMSTTLIEAGAIFKKFSEKHPSKMPSCGDEKTEGKASVPPSSSAVILEKTLAAPAANNSISSPSQAPAQQAMPSGSDSGDKKKDVVSPLKAKEPLDGPRKKDMSSFMQNTINNLFSGNNTHPIQPHPVNLGGKAGATVKQLSEQWAAAQQRK